MEGASPMTSPEQPAPEAGVDPWERKWLSPQDFPLAEGLLRDLSVSQAEEFALRRSRWSAMVSIELPSWVSMVDAVALANYIDAHLRGREPTTATDGRELFIMFSVSDNGPNSHAALREFATSLVSADVFGPEAQARPVAKIFYTDTSDLEHLLPDDMKQIP